MLLQNSPQASPAQGEIGTDQAQQLRDLARRHLPEERTAPRREVPPAGLSRAEGSAALALIRPETERARVIAITSGKGGVGKTNIAVNLAARFAQAGRRTVLLDADMGLANADVLCGLDLRFNLAHVIARRKRLSEVASEAPGGFHLIGGASGLAKMADLPDSEHRRLVKSLSELEHTSDTIFIDTGAGISPNVLSFASAADHVLVVTTPEPTAITDAYATIKVLCRGRDRSDGRPISLLVNQVRSATEANRVYERVAGVVRQFIGADLRYAGFVPADPAVCKAVRQRSPFIVSYPRCAASVCITRLAMRLESGIAQQPRTGDGFFGMLGRTIRSRRSEAVLPQARLAGA